MGASAWPFRCCSQSGVQRALPGQLPGSPPPAVCRSSDQLEAQSSASVDQQHEEMRGIWAADLRPFSGSASRACSSSEKSPPRHCSRPLKLRCMADRGEAPSPCPGIGGMEDSSFASGSVGALVLPEEHFREAAPAPATGVGPDFPEHLSVSGSEIRGLDGVYRCWPGRNHNGLPVWEKVDHKRLLFYSSKKARWYISDKLEDKGFAFATSGPESPIGLAWSNGTMVQEALDVCQEELYPSEFSFKSSYTRFASITRLLPRMASQAGKTPSCAGTQECKRGEELESEMSGASTATGGSTNLRQKRGMTPLVVKTSM